MAGPDRREPIPSPKSDACGFPLRVSTVFGLAALLALTLPACGEGDPTRPSEEVTYTDASVYEDGALIARLLRDGPGRNTWSFAPNPDTGSEPVGGAGAPSQVEMRITTWPESAGSGGDWITVELHTRGVELPIPTGTYPVIEAPHEEDEGEAYDGFTGTLRLGVGLTGGLSWTGRTLSGEIEVLRVHHEPSPSRRIMLEGRLDAEFREVGRDGESLSGVRRAVIEFRLAYPQIT